jgi:hypothetical protein
MVMLASTKFVRAHQWVLGSGLFVLSIAGMLILLLSCSSDQVGYDVKFDVIPETRTEGPGCDGDSDSFRIPLDLVTDSEGIFGLLDCGTLNFRGEGNTSEPVEITGRADIWDACGEHFSWAEFKGNVPAGPYVITPEGVTTDTMPAVVPLSFFQNDSARFFNYLMSDGTACEAARPVVGARAVIEWSVCGETPRDGMIRLVVEGTCKLAAPAGTVGTGGTSGTSGTGGTGGTGGTQTSPVSGQVRSWLVYSWGEPVPGATVSVFGQPQISDTSDGSGRFRLENVPNGETFFTVEAAGHWGTVSLWDVPEDTNNANVELALIPDELVAVVAEELGRTISETDGMVDIFFSDGAVTGASGTITPSQSEPPFTFDPDGFVAVQNTIIAYQGQGELWFTSVPADGTITADVTGPSGTICEVDESVGTTYPIMAKSITVVAAFCEPAP